MNHLLLLSGNALAVRPFAQKDVAVHPISGDPILRPADVIKAKRAGQNAIKEKQKQCQLGHATYLNQGRRSGQLWAPGYAQTAKISLNREGAWHV